MRITHELGPLGDLWNYSLVTREWTWISGSNNVSEFAPKQPANRWRANGWVWYDQGSPILYIYGGATKVGAIRYDLWSYAVKNDTWTKLSGSTLTNQYAIYGSDPHPGSLSGGATWTDQEAGELYLFGGDGYAGQPVGASGIRSGVLNDVWKFTIATGEWSWVSGSKQPNQFGDYHNLPNKIGARYEL